MLVLVLEGMPFGWEAHWRICHFCVRLLVGTRVLRLHLQSQSVASVGLVSGPDRQLVPLDLGEWYWATAVVSTFEAGLCILCRRMGLLFFFWLAKGASEGLWLICDRGEIKEVTKSCPIATNPSFEYTVFHRGFSESYVRLDGNLKMILSPLLKLESRGDTFPSLLISRVTVGE